MKPQIWPKMVCIKQNLVHSSNSLTILKILMFFTVNFIRSRWKQLRDQLRKALRKAENAEKLTPQEKYLINKLSFLKPFLEDETPQIELKSSDSREATSTKSTVSLSNESIAAVQSSSSAPEKNNQVAPGSDFISTIDTLVQPTNDEHQEIVSQVSDLSTSGSEELLSNLQSISRNINDTSRTMMISSKVDIIVKKLMKLDPTVRDDKFIQILQIIKSYRDKYS